MNKIHLPVFDFNAGAKGRGRRVRGRGRRPTRRRVRGGRVRDAPDAPAEAHIIRKQAYMAPRYHLYQNCAFQRLGRGATFINIPLLGRLRVSPFSKRKP